MSDAELRARAREVVASPDDEAAARAWVAAADRSGNEAALARALAHHARLGDAASYDRLARMVPWPSASGHGQTLRFRGEDSALGQRFRGEATEAERRITSITGSVGFRVTRTPLGAACFEGSRLVLRDAAGGAVKAEAPLAEIASSVNWVEFDRALVAPAGGGVVCLDLDPASFGRIVWDTRPRVPSARVYSPLERYVVGDRIRHAKFGEGTVARLAGSTKIVVYFADDEKTLAHGKGGGAALASAQKPIEEHFQRVLLVGSVALLEGERSVIGLDAASGAPRFETRGKATICGGDARGVVVSSRRDAAGRTTKGGLTEIDPRTGEERSFFPGSSVTFLALGERVLLAGRVRRKGWVDREAEREVVALDRDARAALLWRAPDREVRFVTDRHVVFAGREEGAVRDVLTGKPADARR